MSDMQYVRDAAVTLPSTAAVPEEAESCAAGHNRMHANDSRTAAGTFSIGPLL